MKFLYPYIVLMLFLPAAYALEPSTESALSVDGKIVHKIYEGQSVDWLVSLMDADPVEPQLESNGDFQVVSKGNKSLNTTNISIINGQRYDNSKKRHLFVYQLTPNKTGTLTVPMLVFNIEGKRVTAGGETLEVESAAKQDFIRMEILATSQKRNIAKEPIYPMQPFDITLRVWVKALPSPVSDRNPLSALPEPPGLKIPWAMDNLPDGITTASDVSVWLGPYQSEYGFSINEYKKPISPMDIMSDFGFNSRLKQQLYAFLPEGKTVTAPDASGKTAKYYQFDFSRRFTASKTGTYTFGPVSFNGLLVVGIKDGELYGDNVYAVANAVTLSVEAPPKKGRPQDYINAVGLFEMSARLTPNKVRVGDPMTLTLTVRGEGTFDDMIAPKLDSIPEIARNFKLYDVTEKSGEGSLEFTWSIRPLNDKIKEFPTVSASYFDVSSGEYYQMKTAPIPVSVEKGAALLMNNLNLPQNGTDSDKNLKNRLGGVHANITDINRLKEPPFNLMKSSRSFVLTNGIIAAALILITAGIVLFRGLKLNPVQSRRYNAASSALDKIRQARRENNPAERLILASKAIAAYAADRTNTPAAGLTPADVIRLLRQDYVANEPLLNAVNELLLQADAAQYCGLGNASQDWLDEAEKLIRELKSSIEYK